MSLSRKRIVQLVAVGFLLVALFLLIPNTDWQQNTQVIGFISLAIGTAGSIISIFIPSSYTFMFDVNSWEAAPYNDFKLVIDYKKHGMGSSPKTETFELNDGRYEEVGVDTSHDKKGTVIIRANVKLSGKVVVS